MDLRSAWALGRELMEKHGLVDWQLAYDNAKRRAGVCKESSRTISLSAPLTRLHDEDEVRETILHEIAHALVGGEHGHGPVWREAALRIGSTAERCVPEDAPRVRGAWLGVCARGHAADRHRRPERVLLCGRCATGEPHERVFQWTYHGLPAEMHPNYVAELDQLRAGATPKRFGIGHQVRITVAGEFHGRSGTVIKQGRTRYHLRLVDGLELRVLFAAVEAADQPRSARRS